jgi:hypothetical protein
VKPVIYFNSTGNSGNIFFILAEVKRELQKEGRAQDFNEMWEAVQKSGGYTEALSIIREYVDLVDLDLKY